MDSPEVDTNSALLLRSILTGGKGGKEVSATTMKWLKKANEFPTGETSQDERNVRAQLKGEIMGHLRNIHNELDATAWMYTAEK